MPQLVRFLEHPFTAKLSFCTSGRLSNRHGPGCPDCKHIREVFVELGLCDEAGIATEAACEIMARCQDVPHLMVRTALTTDVFQSLGAKGLRTQAALYNAAAEKLEEKEAPHAAADAE